MVSKRRHFGAVLFGLFYGGGVSNGLDQGLQFVLRDQDYSIFQHRALASVARFAPTGLLAALISGSLLLVFTRGVLIPLAILIHYEAQSIVWEGAKGAAERKAKKSP